MTDMDRKKKQVQILKAQAAKAELEVTILERHEDILRIQKHIELQDTIINKLTTELLEK